MAAADRYKVKHVEPVLKSSDVLARIFTLAPGDTIPCTITNTAQIISSSSKGVGKHDPDFGQH